MWHKDKRIKDKGRSIRNKAKRSYYTLIIYNIKNKKNKIIFLCLVDRPRLPSH